MEGIILVCVLGKVVGEDGVFVRSIYYCSHRRNRKKHP